MKKYITILVAVLALTTLEQQMIWAANLGWWRMGDSDGGLTIPPSVGNTIGGVGEGVVDEYGGDNEFTDGNIYSDIVPAPMIFDPISSTTVPNAWSTFSPSPGVRGTASGTTPASAAVSVETFVRFDNLVDGSGGVEFLYHLSNSTGGWRLKSFANGSLRLDIKEEDNGGDGVTTSYDSGAGLLNAGEWHHLAVIAAPDATGNDDVFVYLDGNVIISENYTEDDAMPASSFPFQVGSTFSADTGSTPIYFDETRYFTHAISPSDFLQLSGVPVMSLTIDRNTGAMTLANDAGASASFDLQGYSITSESGALDHSGWKTITDHYDDVAGPGDGSVDADDEWTILSSPTSSFDLSEFQFGGTPGDGGTIAPGESVVLSEASGAWIQNPVEDVVMEVVLLDGSITSIPVVFVGNGGNSLTDGDFNGDGAVSELDWFIFRANYLTDFTGSSPAQAYSMGDLDDDLDSDINDFVLFKSLYNTVNGEGSFAAMIQNVPEPSSLLLLGAGGIGMCFLRRASRFSVVCSVLLLFVLNTPTAKAENFAWWRMGDSDSAPAADQLTGTGFGADTGIVDEYGGENDLFRGGETTDFRYSLDVPGLGIYDPISDTTVGNHWSAYSGSPGGRPQADMSTPAPNAVSVESFVRFDSLSDGLGGVDFLFQLSNSSGGWRMRSYADGTIDLLIKEEDGVGDGVSTTFSSAPGILQPDTWHHVAMIAAPDASGNDDVAVYVDGVEVISGNYTEDDVMPASSFPFLVGIVFSTEGEPAIPFHADETRYFTHAITPADFLQIDTSVALKAAIHPVTGETVIFNNTFDSIELDNYQIDSPMGALLPGAGQWNSFADQNLDPVDGGDETGETWEEFSGSDASTLAELFLLGATMLEAGESISIGDAYNTGLTDNEMSLLYHDAITDTVADGLVEFMLLGDMDGDGELEEDDDVNAFVQALTNRAGYVAAHPGLLSADLMGDFDGNGKLDLGDVAMFKAAIALSGSASAGAVPEPSSGFLLCGAALALFAVRRRQR